MSAAVRPQPDERTPRWSLSRGSEGYPECLERSPWPPAILNGYGDAALLRPGLAIVGARKATPYGLRCATMFAERAAALGVIVVSGAAVGCDSAAQRAALAAGGRSVAVLGCGADVDYPRSSATLLAMLRERGAVVSEMPWSSPPVRWAFPRRNRLIAALSAAVLVVEAALPSGTFVTADHALDAGRDVLAVPGSIFFSGSAGCNRLIAQGACVLTCLEDLDEVLVRCGLASGPVPSASPLERHSLDDPLLRAVLADPARPDQLCLDLDADVSSVTSRLAALERAGRIRRYADGRFGPC